MSKSRSVKMLSISTTLAPSGERVGGGKVYRWGQEGEFAEAHCDCGWKSPPCPERGLPSKCPQCDHQIRKEEA